MIHSIYVIRSEIIKRENGEKVRVQGENAKEADSHSKRP